MMIQGTATDYQDLAEIIYATGPASGVTAPVINAAGTLYVQGDIITVAGGTSVGPGAATIEVLTVGGSGDILTMKVKMAGAYTANPTTTANAVTGGTGSAATVDITMLGYGWTQRRRTQEAASAVVATGGTNGYIVGDLLTVTGGVGVGASAIFRVATESAGVVLTVDQGTGAVVGDYAEVPANDVAVTGGSGTGAITLTVTWADALTQDSEYILEGEGASTDAIMVGIRSYNDATVFNWELAGFTGYSATDLYTAQPGISPGRHTDATSVGGSFVSLATTSAQTLEYWMHIDTYSISGVARNGTSYQSWYLGWLNPFGTASEFTYPLCIAGNCSLSTQAFNGTDIENSGISDPIVHIVTAAGPMQYRTQAGLWENYFNSSISGANRNIARDKLVLPTGGVNTLSPGDIVEPDLVFTDSFSFADSTNTGIIPASGDPGVAEYTLARTPDTGGDISIPFPLTLVNVDPAVAIQGELRNCYWVHNDGGIVAEDDFRISGVDYRVFQAGTRSNNWTFWALKEN